jgi:WD40 repeat protein
MTEDRNGVRLWDTATNNQIRPPITISNRYSGHTALSPDGHRLAALISGGKLEVWDVDKGRKIDSVSSYGEDTVAFSPDGHTFATTSDKTITLWTASSE